MVKFYSHHPFPFYHKKHFLEECKNLAELDFNMFSPVSKIQRTIRGGEMCPQKTHFRLTMNQVKLETCCEKRYHSLNLTTSQCLNVKRWTQTIWLGQSHVFISWSLQHASRMLRIKYEDHCSGSILLQMSQLWKHVACTTDCIMSYINSHRKYTGTLELLTEGSAPLLKANFHDSCWTLLD